MKIFFDIVYPNPDNKEPKKVKAFDTDYGGLTPMKNQNSS